MFHDRRLAVAAAIQEDFPTMDAPSDVFRRRFGTACVEAGAVPLEGFPMQHVQDEGGNSMRLDVYDFGASGRLALLTNPRDDYQAVCFDEVWPDWLHELTATSPAVKARFIQ